MKPAFRERGAFATRYGALLGDAERAALAADIAARPGAYCGQERVLLGTTPSWSGGALRPVPFVMRLFVAWHDGDYRVMPGGLTRFNPAGADAIVSLQKGGETKDTWVLAGTPEEDLPPKPNASIDLDRRPAATPSRLADNLFWLGRYLERTAQLARLLDRLDPLLRDEIAALDPSVATDSLRILLAAQQSAAPAGAAPDEIAAQIRVHADDAQHAGSLAANLGQLIRILDQVKVNLPPEFWRILRRLRAIATQGHPQLAADLGEQLSSLEALGSETLAHDTGWRFLDLGRRIERARQIVFLARALLLPERPERTSAPRPRNSACRRCCISRTAFSPTAVSIMECTIRRRFSPGSWARRKILGDFGSRRSASANIWPRCRNTSRRGRSRPCAGPRTSWSAP